ncbi:MAG: precorrin-3B C(17)-methyltransferase [Pseudomonadota bacterium]
MGPCPAIVCLTASGSGLAKQIAAAIGGEVFGKAGRVGDDVHLFDGFSDHVADLFLAGRPIVGLCAAGILIRAVAPFLADKTTEPPVLCVAEGSKDVVPLLGGHRGANDLARRIADAIDGQTVVTTAGEGAFGLALDNPGPGWALRNPRDAKPVMAALLAGAGASVEGALPFDTAQLKPGDAVRLIATETAVEGDDRTLVYHPKSFCLGVGASRHCPPEELIELAETALAEHRLAEGCLAGVFSVDLKMDEVAVQAVAERFDVPMRFFTADDLERETPRMANPSEIVFAEIGCHGVAEAAALAAAGETGTLVIPKRKSAMGTIALARAPEPLVALAGLERGHLSVVGIGPGEASMRTPQATRAIAAADELVGYGLYIDLLGPTAAGKVQKAFPLGGEEDRCRYALERAGEGHRVALVCSGDAGIYAMAALVYELLDRSETAGGVSAAARRAAVDVIPGVSALQAAAARLGAPMGHDFCAISLSDLLTPREVILQRLEAAASGDFVIAFYNPVSKTRRDLLNVARDILLRHRPGTTPVALATSLGRPEETIRHRTLQTLQVDEVDMLTTVLIGASQTRSFDHAGHRRVYTPRGYAKKLEKGAA